ncbi:MAG TPA: M23 family metallopeptidase [Gemmatimonadaceae bacterium]|nr:M23 family metallopeptidase [Gemmatimonadaceae bacterium]
MPQRRWTLLIVPESDHGSRSITISERALRWLLSSASVLALLALVGVGVLIAGVARPAFLSRTPGAVGGGVVSAQEIQALHDTLDAIAARDEQIRLLAGLSDPDSALSDSASEAMRLASADPADLELMIQRANTLAASFAEVSDSLADHAERYTRIPSIMPTVGWLSSAFSRSRFHPILHIARPHEGIDVSAPMGAPIVAPADGIVIQVGRQNGYGNVLEIDHGNGIVTKYAHCSRILVRRGQRVKRGQVIAAVGNTGLATGPHLHYEIHVRGRVVDPLTYVLPAGANPD